MPRLRSRLLKLLPMFKKPKECTFNTLPPDLIFEIFDKLDSFGDLNALITASSTCYRLFTTYQASILTRIARNILGMHAWQAATAVLVHQRHTPFDASNPLNLIAFEKDILAGFTMQRSDIPQLITNQRWFENCLNDFATFVSLRHRPHTEDQIMDLVLSDPTPIPALHPNITFVAGDFNTCDLLCSSRFYHIFQNCFRCRQGDEEAWNLQNRWTGQPTVQCFLIHRIMRLTFARPKLKFDDSTFQRVAEPQKVALAKVLSTKSIGDSLAFRFDKSLRPTHPACGIVKL